MSELDVLLRESLGRLAEPGDPAGVVEAIRARVEAAGSSGDGGFGGGPSGGGTGGLSFWGGWAPLGGLAILAASGGAALGLGLPTPGSGAAAESSAPLSISRAESVPGAACPGGAAVANLDPGARVLALARDDDGGYLAVRDPATLGSIVWVSAGAAVVDPDADVNALPVWGCAETSDIVADPTPTPAPVPDPAPAPVPTPAPGPDPDPKPVPAPPPPPADTQKPTLQVGGWSETYVCTVDAGYGPASASISITVGDNVGVTSVTATSPTAGVSVSGPAGSGATRTFTVSRSGTTDATIQVTFTIKDAAGNSVTGNAPGLDSVGPGNCLI